MAYSLNKMQIIGNLGQDPEVKYLPNGGAVCNFSVATGERWKDKTTGENKERTEWHRVVFYGKPAEIIGEFVRKGAKIYVEGKLATRKWQDQNGNDRYTTEIVGADFIILDGQQSGQQQQKLAEPQRNTPAPVSADFEDDIPF